MKNLSIPFLIVIFFLAIPQKASLQKYKYGKVSKELLEMTECELDKEAEAMITYITGDNSVLYSSSEGFYTVLKVKKQIKIFNQNAKDAGTNFITFYSPKGGRGKVKFRGLKGKTYNLENDKIVEIKLKDENIFETQINNYYKRVSLTMPNVQKNSVFEFEYELESEFYTNIDDWDLQSEYPVIYNEFYTSMPQYYKYQINITGPYAPKLDETNTYDELLQNSVYGSDRIKIPFTKRKIIYENLPSLGDEPYVANKSDIKAKITHQLILIDWPGQMIRNIATDYQGLSKSLLESSDFGSIIKDGDFIETFVDVKAVKSQLEIAEKVYETFTEKIKWDGYNHYRSGFGGKKLFKEGKGDAGDINLNYIAALNHLGITTIPVIISTRGNGTLHPQYPDYSDFDYVFAISSIGEKLYYSDATSGLPFGNLPLRCLNGSGWMVSDKASDWISTKKDFFGRHVLMTEITFLNNEQHYKCTESRSNFFAYSDYESLKYKDEFTFLKSKYNPDNLKVDSLAIIEKKQSSIKSIFLGHHEIDDESLKYVFPFELKPLKENPFKKESRNTIIDYPYLQDYRFVTAIEIKEDEIFEAPQNLNAALEGNIITFKYHSNFNAGIKKLTVNAELKINKNEFLPDEYPEVKEAFETIINKLNEPVIIKKEKIKYHMTIDFLNMSNGKIKSYLIQNKLALKWTIKKSLTKKSYLLVLYLSLMLDLCGQYRLENIPDSLLIGANSIILDQYEKVEILNKNKIIHHIKSKSIILNDDEENLTKILVLYDQYSKVENFEVKISDLSGKKIKTIKKKDLQDIAYQDGFSIANDARILFYNIIGIQAPFIIDKEFTIIAEQSFHLPSSSPYEGEKVSILNSLFEILNHDTLNQLTFYNPLGENIDSSFSKGVHTYTLIFQNLDHKYLENKYANKQSSQLKPILTGFSMDNKDGSFKSWKDFGSWIWNLSNETGELSETAKNEIIALLKNEKNERIKLNILYNYLQQNMRYVSVQLGIGGFKPMNVQDVHNFKYGDCKALSNYMMHILKVAGIKSNYILIGAGTGDDLQDISIVRNSFNHAIIAAYPEGDTVFLECTSSITPSGYQGNFTGNRHALLIDEINSKIIKTSVYTETNNVIKNNYDVNIETQKVDHSQTLLGIGIEYKDLLYKIQLPDEKLRDHLIENSSDINELKIKNKKFENQTGYPEIVLTTSFESSKKILSTGSRYFIELNYDKPPVEMIYKKTEENQLNIFNGFTIHDAFNISMPSGCFVEKLPKDFELNYSSGSVAISTTPNPESGKLIYKRSIIYKNGKFGLGKGDDGELLLDAVKKGYSDKIVINCKS